MGYLVESERRGMWMCAGEVEPYTGGKIVFDFDDRWLTASPAPTEYQHVQSVYFEGIVLAWKPLQQMRFSFPEADGKGKSEVTLTLQTSSDGTQLHLVHQSLEGKQVLIAVATGWHAQLDLLQDIIAGEKVRDFWKLLAVAKDYYQQHLLP